MLSLLRRACVRFGQFQPHGVTCWNCQSNDFVNQFICGQCKHLREPCQSLHNVTFFQIFDLPLSVELDLRKLEEKYRQLQCSFHPDKVIAQLELSSVNVSYSQKYSAFINEAYSTLRDEISRAEYVLQLRGYAIKENSVLNDLEFMEEILEKQQKIQERTEIKEIQEENEQQIQQMTGRLKKLIKENHLSQAYNLLLYLRYRLRIRDQINLL